MKSSGNPTILIPIGVFLPGLSGGGPIRSIANLIKALSDSYDFKILTSSKNLEEATEAHSLDATRWHSISGADVRYLPPSEQNFLSVSSHILSISPDAIYLNALFPTPFTLPALFLNALGLLGDTRVIVAPRGQLYPGALRENWYIKQLFLLASRWLGAFRDVQWHATSEEEVQQVTQYIGDDRRVSLAPNLGTEPSGEQLPELSREFMPDGKLRVIFLSRIDPKKNLLAAIDILDSFAHKALLNVYGPVSDDAYWKRCRERMSNTGDQLDVDYGGVIPKDEVFKVFSKHDLFLFPTQGENFGHVIYESLAAGCPVMVSQSTPWRNLEEEGVGWDLSLDQDDTFRTALSKITSYNVDEWYGFRKRARQFALDQNRREDDIEKVAQLFSALRV